MRSNTVALRAAHPSRGFSAVFFKHNCKGEVLTPLPSFPSRSAEDRLQQHRGSRDVLSAASAPSTASSPLASRCAFVPSGFGQPGAAAGDAACESPRAVPAEGAQPALGGGVAQWRPR